MAGATICLDPGHGGHDPGAVRGGVGEKTLTLAIALAARDALREDHRVVLTRERDVAVPLPDRIRAADLARAAVFVSIHVNAAADPDAEGYEAFVRRGAPGSGLPLAATILREFGHRWPDRRNRGVKQAGYFVLRQARPACLIECFFLSNENERARLAAPGALTALGRLIAAGCRTYLRELPSEFPV